MSKYSIEPFGTMITDARNTLKPEKAGVTPWKKMYLLTLRNFYVMQGKPGEKVDCPEKAIEETILQMYAWYKGKYSTPSSEEEHPKKKAEEKCEKRDSPHRETFTSVLKENSDAFDQKYKFSKPYTEQLFSEYLCGKKKPSVEFILHLAVAFKFTPKECNEILQSFEYFPLHSKNVFHLAVYCVLLEMENKKGLCENDFTQFQHLKDIYQQAIKMLSSKKTTKKNALRLRNEPDIFLAGKGRGSTTYLTQYFQENISSKRFAAFIQRHKDEFDERHSKIQKEYFRMLNICMSFFDESNNVNVSEYSFHSFILSFCRNLDRKHYKRDLVKIIEGKGREPTREMLIILWTWEFCFLTAGDLELTLSDALYFLRKSKEPKVKGISINDRIFVEKVLLDSVKEAGFGVQLDALKEWKTASAQPLEDCERKDIESFFDVTFSSQQNNIVLNMHRLLDTRPIMKPSSWGSTYMLYMNAKLRSFGYSILSSAKSFDRCFMMLQYVTFKENSDGGTTWYYQTSSAHTTLLHLKVRNQFGYPDSLRFLFLYLDAYKKLTKVEYPLECDIYKKH